MAWCENCKEEYLDTITNCSICGAELSDKHYEDREYYQLLKEKSEYHSIKEKVLFSPNSDTELFIVLGALDEENISYRVMEKESGQYTRIYLGLNVAGKDVFVREADFDKANAILKAIKESAQNIDLNNDDNLDYGDDSVISFSKRKKVMIWGLRIVLGFIVLWQAILLLLLFFYR